MGMVKWVGFCWSGCGVRERLEAWMAEVMGLTC